MNKYLAQVEIDRIKWEAQESARQMDAKLAAALAARAASRSDPNPNSKWPGEQQRAALHRFLAQAGTPGAPTVFYLSY